MRAVMNSGRFLDMQSHQPAPMITVVTMDSAREDCVVITAQQFCLHVNILVRSRIYDFSSPMKGIILRARTYTITLAALYASPSATLEVFMFQSTITLEVSYTSPSTTLEVFLFQSIITLAVPCASSSVHHTDSFPLSVLPTISPTNSHIRES